MPAACHRGLSRRNLSTRGRGYSTGAALAWTWPDPLVGHSTNRFADRSAATIMAALHRASPRATPSSWPSEKTAACRRETLHTWAPRGTPRRFATGRSRVRGSTGGFPGRPILSCAEARCGSADLGSSCRRRGASHRARPLMVLRLTPAQRLSCLSPERGHRADRRTQRRPNCTPRYCRWIASGGSRVPCLHARPGRCRARQSIDIESTAAEPRRLRPETFGADPRSAAVPRGNRRGWSGEA